MSEISDLVWAQHIKMDYAQNIRKDPNKPKNKTLRKFLQDTGSAIQICRLLKIVAKSGL